MKHIDPDAPLPSFLLVWIGLGYTAANHPEDPRDLAL
jgi:hypothetical protein